MEVCVKLRYNELDDIPSYYHLLNIKVHYTCIKNINIDIKSICDDRGAWIHCEFTNGRRYTAMVFNEKHYSQEIKKIKDMVREDIEQQLIVINKRMEILKKSIKS